MNTHDFDPNPDTLNCRQCGLPHGAHRSLPDHPEEAKLREQENVLASQIERLAEKASRSLRSHNRVDAVVKLSQLELVVDRVRLAQRKAIDDQMGQN